MANATRTVRVRFDGSAAGLSKAAKQAERDLQRVQKSAAGFRDGAIKFGAITGLVGAIGSLGGPAVAGGVAALGALGGVAAAAGLAFSGTGDAVEAYNKALEDGDWSEYNKLLAKMPPAQREFTRELVKTGDQFKSLKKTAAENALPGVTNAIKATRDLLPTLDAAVKRSSKVISDTGDDFAELFRSDEFKKNLDGWSRAVEPVERSIGRFLVNTTGQLAKFGSEQKAAAQGFASFLDSTSAGLGGMFDELAPYSEDFKQVWESLGDIVEEVLPVVGRFFGEAARVWGPVLRDIADWLAENRDTVKDWAGAIAAATPYLLGAAVALKGLKTAAAAVDFAQLIGRMVGLGGEADKAGKNTSRKFVGGLKSGLGKAAIAGAVAGVAANVAASFADQDWKSLGTTYGDYVTTGFADSFNKLVTLDFGGFVDNLRVQGRRAAAEIAKFTNGGRTTSINFIASVDTGIAKRNVLDFTESVKDVDTQVKVGAETMTASQALNQVVTAINEGHGEVEINGQTVPAGEALAGLVAELNATHGTVLIDGNAVPAGDALLNWINTANGTPGPVMKIDADPNPATGKLQTVITNADGSTGTITLDGNPAPAGGKTYQAVTFANGSRGVITIDGNQKPSDGKVQATVRYADGSTGTVTVAAQNQPAVGTLNQTTRTINGSTGKVNIDADNGDAMSKLRGFLSAIPKVVTVAIQGVKSALGFAAGGAIEGFAKGGPIRGPGTGTSDSIPALVNRRKPINVANGEHILTAREVRAAGGHGAIMRLRQAILAGGVPGFAGGGPVDAARAILARMRSGQQLFEDWTWKGAPGYVGQFNDQLHNARKAAGFSYANGRRFLEEYVRKAEATPNVLGNPSRIIASAATAAGQAAATSGASSGRVDVKVYIDGQEFKGMVRAEIASESRQTRRLVGSGAGRGI